MGVEELLVKGRRDMKPLLLKTALALSFSFAAFLFSHLRSRTALGRHPLLPPPSPPGAEAEGGRKAGGGLKDELRLIQYEEASPKVSNGTATAAASAIVGLSPSSKSSGDGEGYLLPEFNELVLKEFELVGRDQDTLATPTTKRLSENKEETVTEQQIVNLKNLVRSLRERERSLEIQLLEYYGLKEQETAVKELENRLKINTMEAKLFSLKIESLQADNRRLEAQVSDYSRIKAELELAKGKIKHLKRKLRSDSEQAKEKVAALHQRVAALEDGKCGGGEDDGEVERSLKRFKDLENEAADLRRANSRLARENSDLAKKLESTQILASSVLESPEATEALEEANRLRQTNDELTKEIEQLQLDRCADVEELVYLRWINACLRYELRNYQPPPGKTVARDLSKTLSPKSEQKAKQLILEYANSGINEKSFSPMDFDSEYCSSSQASSLTETGELDDTSVDVSTTKNSGSSKTKLFSKLKRLVLGKDSRHNRVSSVDRSRSPTSCGNSERRPSVSMCSLDEMVGRDSYDSLASCITLDNAPGNQLMAVEAKMDEQQQSEAPWTRNLSRVSLDFQRLRSLSHEDFREVKGERCKSDVGTSYRHARMVSGEESLLGSPLSGRLGHETFNAFEKAEPKKFADASKRPRGKLKLRGRSASFSLY